MRTLLMIVWLCGLLLTPMPEVAYGGPTKTTQVKTTPVGLASWYGQPHQGRKTASGARVSRQPLTAAHCSLPLGTKVKVTNLRTKQQGVVTINDRGQARGHTGARHRTGGSRGGRERLVIPITGELRSHILHAGGELTRLRRGFQSGRRGKRCDERS
jgi:hypothetical protein